MVAISFGAKLNAQDSADAHIASLTAPGWKARWQAAQTLGELGDPRAVQPLIKTLGDDNQWVRIVTAEALGLIGDQKAIPALISGLDDENIWVRRASVVALGQIGDPRAIPPLLNRLLGSSESLWPEDLRDTAAKALGDIGEPAIQVLIEALEDSDVWVSGAAARALGQIGDPQAISPLSSLIKGKQSWVRSAATQALAQITDARAVRAALTADEAPRAFWKLMALKEIDQSTINQLTGLMEDPDEHIRTQAAQVLNRLGEDNDAEPLPANLGVKLQSAFRGQATPHPSEIPDRPALEAPDRVRPLLAALQDPVPEVRAAAVEALGKIGDASVIYALSEVLSDSDSHVRAAAARALGQIG
jgi:HEAT repeat protein